MKPKPGDTTHKLRYILAHITEPTTIDDLVPRLDMGRSRVNDALARLCDCKCLTRKLYRVGRHGRYYLYTPTGKPYTPPVEC